MQGFRKRVDGMNDRNKRDGVTLGLNQDNFCVEDRTGGAHPGTEQRPMCRGLMLRMVPGMFSGLRLRQPADRENAKHKGYRKELAKCVTHATKHFLIGLYKPIPYRHTLQPKNTRRPKQRLSSHRDTDR